MIKNIIFNLSMFFLIPGLVFAQSSANLGAVMGLYEQGDLDGAREKIEAELAQAKNENNDFNLWNALMTRAWLEDELSNHREALNYSNQALEIANKIDNHFAIGRSLCWLGWAYSHMGLYELSKSFYQNALEIGAPGGKIKYLNVWGLALQELGALKAKMGDLKDGRKDLDTAYNAAKEAGVDAGVAESGAHLAEISLLQGDLDSAIKFSKSAVKAGEQCHCSPYNLTRAKIVEIKVALAKIPQETDSLVQIKQKIELLQNECEKLGHIRCKAESKILLSKILPKDNFSERFNLVSSALEDLSNSEKELAGQAEAELGRVYLDQNNINLAEFYLKNGLQVSKELFRKVDAAYILTDLAKSDSLQQKDSEAIEKLIEATNTAKKSRAIDLAYHNQKELADKYKILGYYSLALKWNQEALESLNYLISKNKLKKEAYEREKLSLIVLRTELLLFVEQDPPGRL